MDSDTRFLRIQLRDVIEIAIVLVAVVMYFASGFNKGDSNSKDVVELAKTVANMATSMHDLDINGTRYSARKIAELEVRMDAENKKLESLENNYKTISDILSEIKGKVTLLVTDKRK